MSGRRPLQMTCNIGAGETGVIYYSLVQARCL